MDGWMMALGNWICMKSMEECTDVGNVMESRYSKCGPPSPTMSGVISRCKEKVVAKTNTVIPMFNIDIG